MRNHTATLRSVLYAGRNAMDTTKNTRLREVGRIMILASVTEILKPWSDFSRIPPAVLEAASVRGTAVHDICATIARRLPLLTIPDECYGYVESFNRWFELVVDDVLLVETRLVDMGFAYHGEPDLIIKAKHGEIILVDNKTPIQLVKTWQLQCAGYFNLADKNGMRPDKCGSLRLDPKGGIAKMTFYENSLQDFNLFLQALNLHRFFNTK